MDKNIEELFVDYLNSSPEQKETLRQQLVKSGVDVEKLEKLYDQMGQITVPPPDEKMTEDFYQMLENQKRTLKYKTNWIEETLTKLRKTFRNPYVIRFAYSMCLFLAGWFIGINYTTGDTASQEQFQYMSSEISEMKKMLTYTMLNQPSPAERIKAIHYIRSLSHVDDQMISAMLHILNHDPNVNVRLVTLETLLNFAERSQVRNGLIHSINQQGSPIIQLSLANSMILLKDKEAIGQLKELLRKKDLNYTVRKRIEKSLKMLI